MGATQNPCHCATLSRSDASSTYLLHTVIHSSPLVIRLKSEALVSSWHTWPFSGNQSRGRNQEPFGDGFAITC